MPTVQQKKNKENKTYCVVGGTNFGQFFFFFFFSTLYLLFLRVQLQRIFFFLNEITLFIQLFLFLLLVIFLGVVAKSFYLYNFVFLLCVLQFFGTILDSFFFQMFLWWASSPIESIFGFHWTKMSCQSCSFNYYSCIVQFFESNEESMEFLCSHGVLPTTVTCSHCKSLCTYRKDQKTWRCWKRISVPKSKKTMCSFTISDFKGSFFADYQYSALENWVIC